MKGSAPSTWGGIAHVFLAIALCLPLVTVAAMIGVSMAAPESSMLNLALLSMLAIVFLAVVVWASLLPPVRQVEVSTARALLEYDEEALPDVRSPRAWVSRRRGAAWLALLAGVGLVVAAAILYLVPAAIGLLSFPLSGRNTMTWPGTGMATHTGPGWHASWLVVPGLLILAACIAVVRAAAWLLVALAPGILGPTLVERVGLAAERERALARANAVARELHDRLGHTLTAMTVQATAAHRLLATDLQAAERALAAVEDLGRRAQGDVDSVVRTLRDGAQAGAAMSGEPRDLVGIARSLAEESTLDVQMRVPQSLPVNQDWADTAQAVIREALTNATRHGTGSAALRLEAEPGSVSIEVRNPIRGMSPARPKRAGLTGLQECVLLAGGEITAGPDGGESWVLTAKLPISRPASMR